VPMLAKRLSCGGDAIISALASIWRGHNALVASDLRLPLDSRALWRVMARYCDPRFHSLPLINSM
jgi:hypothetical protein